MKRLPACPESPNCVCSDDSGPRHIAPLLINGNPEIAWQALSDHLQSRRGIRIISNEDGHLKVQASTSVWRFVDDLDFQLRAVEKTIAVRSASRVGYWDCFTNRLRIESIRRALIRQNLVDPDHS